MDPASIVGITAASLSLLKLLLEGSMGLQTALRDIKNIDDNTENLAAEIAAFDSILQIFNVEIRDGQFLPYVNRWWDSGRLEGLLSNAVKTYSHLDVIVKDVARQRSVLVTVRQYWTSKKYDKEIGHLRLRIGTYIKALQIPIELGRIHNIKASVAPQGQGTARYNRTQRDVDVLANQVLGDRVGRLEESIDSLSRGISNLLDARDQLWSTPIQRESGELVAVVQTLAASASNASVASSIGAPTVIYSPGQASSYESAETIVGYSPSVHGVPMTHHARQRVSNWMSDISSTTSVSDISDSASRLSLSSDPTSTQYTAPSTVHGRRDIRAELVERRYKQAMQLLSEKKYQEAIPHLKRTIAELSNSPEYAQAIGLEPGSHKLTLVLAKCLIRSAENRPVHQVQYVEGRTPGYSPNPPIPNRGTQPDIVDYTVSNRAVDYTVSARIKPQAGRKRRNEQQKLNAAVTRQEIVLPEGPYKEAYDLLLPIYQNTTTSITERADAAYLLALCLFLCNKQVLNPFFAPGRILIRGRMAKECCEEAVQWHNDAFGRDDPTTHKSISLLVEICRQQNDSDADLWMEMLPESYHTKRNTMSSQQVNPYTPTSLGPILLTTSIASPSQNLMPVGINNLTRNLQSLSSVGPGRNGRGIESPTSNLRPMPRGYPASRGSDERYPGK